jgi:hypothetical protein
MFNKQKVLAFLNRYKLVAIGSVVGAVAGYLYWQEIGCVSGTCPITSKPLNSTLYGAFLFGLLFDNFRKKQDQKTT